MKNTFSKKIRLRLAPSPTGFLHLGNLRTALFSYLLTRRLKGDLVLRVEDTDEKRLVKGALENLVAIFKQLGITFDEGPRQGGSFGPYIQSERFDLYKKYAEELVNKGEAYYCFASAGELEKMRQEQIAQKKPPRYDRRFRNYSLAEAQKRIKQGEAYVIRHKMPLDGTIRVKDELRGEISFAAEEIEDYVLLKSDGRPTYQLASVVDDHLMRITHVTRGEEWIPSLPKNIALYKSFGWTPPKFIHFPLILNKGGGKLSKRQGDVFVEDYLKLGYLPVALVNFCALLGWHPKNDQEFFTLKELEKIFSLKGVGTSPAVFDQEKLDFLNAHYIRSLSLNKLLPLAKPFLPTGKTDTFLKSVLELEQPRLHYLAELKQSTSFFFSDSLKYEPKLLLWKKITPRATIDNLNKLMDKLINIPEKNWQAIQLEKMIIAWLKKDDQNLGDYLWPMRVALSGQKASPSPFEIAAVIGKKETLGKIKQATGLLS